jgi:hypothetical protein
VVVGSILGALCGFFGSAPAMMIPGGGQSHGDMLLPFWTALLGAVLGALLGPKVIGAGLRAVERRRVDRLNGDASPTLVPALLYLCGSVVGACASFASLYYAASAPPWPDPRAPVSNVGPVMGRGAALVLGVVLAVASAISLFRAVRSVK